MHRIDTPDAVASRFSDGNPQTGQPGTLVPADYLNDLQENVCAVIEHAGIVLSKGDATQLTNAIIAIATGVAGAGVGAGSVPTTRQVLTGGLASGGHALDSDVTIDVPKASSADVIAGTEAAKVVTPDLLGTVFGAAGAGAEDTVTLPGGRILKIGGHDAYISGEGAIDVTFATPFPTACKRVQLTAINATGANNRDLWMQVVSRSATGFVAYAQSSSGGGTIDGFDFIAWGY